MSRITRSYDENHCLRSLIILQGRASDHISLSARSEAWPWRPTMMWATSRARGLFVCDDAGRQSRPAVQTDSLFKGVKAGAMELLRRRVFDRFSRGTA